MAQLISLWIFRQHWNRRKKKQQLHCRLKIGIKIPWVMNPGGLSGGQVGFQEVSPRIKSRKFWHLVAAGCSLKLIGAGVSNQLSQGRCAEWEQGRWSSGNYRLENHSYFIYCYMILRDKKEENKSVKKKPTDGLQKCSHDQMIMIKVVFKIKITHFLLRTGSGLFNWLIIHLQRITHSRH